MTLPDSSNIELYSLVPNTATRLEEALDFVNLTSAFCNFWKASDLFSKLSYFPKCG
jgi:hypothetical protein